MPKPKDEPLFPFWVEDRRLCFFLAFLVLISIFVLLNPLSRSGRIGLDLVFALMIFSGAIATIRQRALMYLVVAVTVIEFTAGLIVEFNAVLGHLGWDTPLKLSGMGLLAEMTLRHKSRPGPIHRAPGHGWSRRLTCSSA
jgi:hypothetical protein